jgi:hypothetical protein
LNTGFKKAEEIATAAHKGQTRRDGTDYIIVAVDLVTHKNRMPNIEYWAQIATNADATEVKVTDIKDNLGDAPSDRQKDKYTQALALFKQCGYSV